jgi:DNA repair protein REV1
LPSFSQVDKEVFDALPEDLRQELQAEYKRRSTSPCPIPDPPPPEKLTSKTTIKGTNLKRITQQLAPRSRPMMKSSKNPLFARRDGPSSVRISEAELRKLDIDPEVFTILPVDVQREQLIMARHVKTGGSTNVTGERKVIKPFNRVRRSPSVPYHRRPLPRANHPQPPFLKQQGKEKGEKLYFTETEDVQNVMESWVEGFRAHPPNQKDVDYFAKFLVQCVDGERSTDVGIEKAVGVVKWWLVLLRRYWHTWERAGDVGDGESREGRVGKAWWRAFRDVKKKMDVVARKKFGGSLSLS